MSNEVKKWTIISFMMIIWSVSTALLADWAGNQKNIVIPIIITLVVACGGYIAIVFFWMWLHYEKYPNPNPPIDLSFKNENELKVKIWDAFLESYMQDEQWHDQDTVNLIVKKLKGESEIKYAEGLKL